MKQFFKFLFASMLGFVLASFFVVFLLIAVIVSVAAAADTRNAVNLKENAIFHLELSGIIEERSKPNTINKLLSYADKNQIGLDEILDNIRKAKGNDNIKGILLETDLAQIGISSAKEIRDALIDFKKSGKFIVANGGVYTQTLYYIASIADKIILNPSGTVEFKGLAVTPVFYKNALDKLGIEMQLIKVGTYKSFAEQYTNTEMSEENREQVSVYVNSIWNTMLDDISEARNISKDSLNLYADKIMTFQTAHKIAAYNFVDTLLYSDEINKVLSSYMNIDEKNIQLVTLSQLNNIPHKSYENVKEKIAIVYATGSIENGSSSFSNDNIDSDKLVETLRKIKQDSLIKAVVLRINSPGGSAYGSEQIWREISLLKERKPVVVSMSDFAASGGYYIACNADAIVAQPTTLTGSIGIFGLIPNVKGLTDKLGIDFDIVKTNEKADMPSLTRTFTPQEELLMQMYVNEGYELFVKRCADGRNMSIDDIKSVAEGRVWTGKDAKEIGLIDELGGIQTALDIAAGKAKLESFRIVEYPEKKDVFTELFENLDSNMQTKILKIQLGENYKHYVNLKKAEEAGKVMAIMPFELDIK